MKKIIAVLIALILVFAFSVVSFAEPELKIYGDMAILVMDNSFKTADDISGNVSYDSDTKTITLSDVSIKGHDYGIVAYLSPNETLTIISNDTDIEAEKVGIIVLAEGKEETASLSIMAKGFSVSGNESGIFADGDVVINDSEISAAGRNSIASWWKNVSIKNSEIVARGTHDGIYANYDIYIEDSDIFAAVSGDEAANGIYSEKGDITVTGKDLKVESESDGVWANGGKVFITAPISIDAAGYGIYSGQYIFERESFSESSENENGIEVDCPSINITSTTAFATGLYTDLLPGTVTDGQIKMGTISVKADEMSFAVEDGLFDNGVIFNVGDEKFGGKFEAGETVFSSDADVRVTKVDKDGNISKSNSMPAVELLEGTRALIIEKNVNNTPGVIVVAAVLAAVVGIIAVSKKKTE